MASGTPRGSEGDERAARIKRNRRAIALLRKWKAAADDEQRDTWEFLKKVLTVHLVGSASNVDGVSYPPCDPFN